MFLYGRIHISCSQGSIFYKGVGSQLMLNTGISAAWNQLEAQAGHLLNQSEQGALRYYLSEYQAGFISVDGLAMATFELFNTSAKVKIIRGFKKKEYSVMAVFIKHTIKHLWKILFGRINETKTKRFSLIYQLLTFRYYSTNFSISVWPILLLAS